jgi:hypothetical protein
MTIAASSIDPEPARRERADILHVMGARGEQNAVGVERERDAHVLVAGVAAGDQILVAVLDPLDRPAEPARGRDHRDLVVEREHLLPETAPDVAHDHPDPVLRHVEEPGEEQPYLVHALAGDDHLQTVAPAVPGGDQAPRLHRDRQVAVLLERLGDDVRGGREHLVDIGAWHLRELVSHVRAELGMHQRGAVGGGAVRVHHRRQRVDVGHHQVGSVLGQVPGLGHDQGDNISHETDVSIGE